MTASSFSKPIHPVFEENNIRGFAPKSDKFQPEWFAQKFTISLMKLRHLKGLHLTLKEHLHSIKHRPKIDSKYNDLLAFEIIHEEKKMGHLYLEVNFISLLLHKVLGGGDRVGPTLAKLPLGIIERKGLETSFGIFNLSLREGLKRSFPLREIDFIQLKGPMDEFQFLDHLELSSQFFVEEFVFNNEMFGIETKVTVVLNYALFDSFGK